MKIKILVMFLIFSCSVNTEMENSNSDVELPALRINQSFEKGYRVLKTTITDPFIFDTKFPATDLTIGYVLRYYFYTAIDLSSTNNVLLSMNNNSFSMPETRDPIELVRAVIYEIRDMAYGSKEYQDFVEKYFSGCIDISKISSNTDKVSLGISLKIRKDSLIWASISAPIIGEINRIMITSDSLYMINRPNSTWSIQSIG